MRAESLGHRDNRRTDRLIGSDVDGDENILAGTNRHEVEKILGRGDMYTIPGGAVHKVIALEDGATALDVFHPIREDYL